MADALVERGYLSGDEVVGLVEECQQENREAAAEALGTGVPEPVEEGDGKG